MSEQMEQNIVAESIVAENTVSAGSLSETPNGSTDESSNESHQDSLMESSVDNSDLNDAGMNDIDSNAMAAISDPSVAQLEPNADLNAVEVDVEVESETLIYAVGVLKPVFPNQGLEHAFNSAARELVVSEYDYYSVFSYLDKKTNTYPYFYIAEQTDWLLRINNEDCYALVPRSKTELLGFIDAVKSPEDSLQEVYTTAIGLLDGSTGTASGMLPKVLCNHVYSQTLDELHSKLQQQTGAATSAIQDVLEQLEFSPNHGNTDFARAKNYLAFRYPDIYLMTHSMQSAGGGASGSTHGTNGSLSINNSSDAASESPYFLETITPTYSDLMSPQTIVDIVLTYKSKSSKQEKYYHCSIDVTRQFPFVNTPLCVFMPVEPMK
ncbi:hypothetical protein CBF23_010945 [Marinomonas agarivorans]|nr:hypothetical protein CBF23_010945 [Marinomonas agarivorans]